ncbi:MAG: hypothetical protein HQ477_06270 [Chloroflexi bacterium]|nr:hypothetical protein [Chloroflexota bacterium]
MALIPVGWIALGLMMIPDATVDSQMYPGANRGFILSYAMVAILVTVGAATVVYVKSYSGSDK